LFLFFTEPLNCILNKYQYILLFLFTDYDILKFLQNLVKLNFKFYHHIVLQMQYKLIILLWLKSILKFRALKNAPLLWPEHHFVEHCFSISVTTYYDIRGHYIRPLNIFPDKGVGFIYYLRNFNAPFGSFMDVTEYW